MLNIIKRPLISEKNSLLSEQGFYAFEVDRKATKTDVRRAVEKSFRVKVDKITTQVCRGRAKRTKLGMGKVRYWKKALVKLQPGEKISIFEGV